METNKILSASWLDILFDNRNKDYGAYQLRKTYERRVTKALFVTTTFIALFIAGSTIAGSVRKSHRVQEDNGGVKLTQVNLPDIPDPIKEPEQTPEQPPEQVKTVPFTTPEIVPDEKELERPIASIEDLTDALPDINANDGKNFTGIVAEVKPPGDGKGIIPDKNENKPDEPLVEVQVQAKFIGDWIKFLLRNLDPEVPTRNGAPPGRHTVIVQFVVDTDGNLSNIKALSKVGYGMEEEAIRVLKKATKWEPAIQNGYKVKAYRQQPITFEVLDE
ncbi:MAG TPA: TonB family protein [Chitinophagaceae bacterium]|nr:TonB family protein [Chitinophagaceae bacterium]